MKLDDYVFSSSRINKFKNSPAKFKDYYIDGNKKITQPMIFGSAVDYYIFNSREEFFKTYTTDIIEQELIKDKNIYNTAIELKERLKFYKDKSSEKGDTYSLIKISGKKEELLERLKEFEHDAELYEKSKSTKIMLTEKEFETIKAMDSAISLHPLAAKVLRTCEFQKKVEWTISNKTKYKSKDDLIKFQGILDAVTTNEQKHFIIDYKTAADGGANPKKFKYTVLDMGYYIQAACYVEWYEQQYGYTPVFYFFVQEKTAPFIMEIFKVPEYLIDLGRLVYKKECFKLITALHENNFQGYENKAVHIIEPNNFKMNEIEESYND